jgi:hypothetical protein
VERGVKGVHSEKALRDYLCEEVFPQLSAPPYGEIEIRRLDCDKPVYLFAEKKQQLLAVGKTFKHGRVSLDKAWFSADREYQNLKTLRDKFGMKDDFCEIVLPLGEKKELSALLVTRKAPGHLLDHYIARAIYDQRRPKLFQKLGYLARFFARLHGNSRTGARVSTALPQWYLDKMLRTLRQGMLGTREVMGIEKQAARWWNGQAIDGADQEVMVHGDATPTNFFFQEQKVTGIDLERGRYADRCWDLGFLAAELKHHFFWRAGDKWAAEPFIGHFLWEYAVNLGDTRFFSVITRKLPLYMAMGLIRMARNKWLQEGYRKMLIEEARLCLEYGR